MGNAYRSESEKYGPSNNSQFYEQLGRHEAPRPHRRKTPKRPINTKPPRTDCCNKQPPACTCPSKETS